MASRRTLDRIILVVLISGAIVFGLLLAGVGSGLLTTSTHYTPPPSTASPSPGPVAPDPS